MSEGEGPWHAPGSLLDPGRLLALIVALAIFGVAAALVSQHVFDMQPCPWCILQRLIFCAIALAALAGALARAWRLPAALLIDGLASAGIAAALWQHGVAAKSSSCNLTLADRIVSATQLDVLLPEAFAVRASCADAAATLLGVPYEFYSLALYALMLVLAMAALKSISAARR